MNFVLPQFIEMEAKIVGPLTLRQFAFVAGGTAISFVIYFSLNKTSLPLAIALIVVVEGAACALGFMKINGIDLPTVIRHWLIFVMSPQIFLWKNFLLPQQITATQEEIVIKKAPSSVEIKATSRKNNLQKLRDCMETI